MILAVHFIPANAHDSNGLGPLIKQVRSQHSQEVLVQKGYKSKWSDEFIAACGSRSRSNPRELLQIGCDRLNYVLCIYLLQSIQLHTPRTACRLRLRRILVRNVRNIQYCPLAVFFPNHLGAFFHRLILYFQTLKLSKRFDQAFMSR